MKLIDRYVYAVTRYLPEGVREDIGKELSVNIEEMLPDDPKEVDIRAVLEELGDPQQLASEYQPRKQYLIGPVLYPQYLTVLKLVVSMVAIILASLAVLDGVFFSEIEVSGFRALLELVAGVIQGTVTSALIVTLIFAVLEKMDLASHDFSLSDKPWSPDDLSEVTIPNNKQKISRLEIIFELFCLIFLVSNLFFFSFSISLENGEVISMFEERRLAIYLPFLSIFMVLEFACLIWKWLAVRWSFKLAMVNMLFNFGFCLLWLVMLNDLALFNAEYFAFLADTLPTNIAFVQGFTRLIIFIHVFDIVSGFRKALNK